jgi:hypothetical protein
MQINGNKIKIYKTAITAEIKKKPRTKINRLSEFANNFLDTSQKFFNTLIIFCSHQI